MFVSCFFTSLVPKWGQVLLGNSASRIVFLSRLGYFGVVLAEFRLSLLCWCLSFYICYLRCLIDTGLFYQNLCYFWLLVFMLLCRAIWDFWSQYIIRIIEHIISSDVFFDNKQPAFIMYSLDISTNFGRTHSLLTVQHKHFHLVTIFICYNDVWYQYHYKFWVNSFSLILLWFPSYRTQYDDKTSAKWGMIII